MDGLARAGQAEGEQAAVEQFVGEPPGRIAEVDLSLHAGLMGLPHERLAGRGPDRPAPTA
ncbi:hypothetical protein [Streptomyces sp. NRRL F-2664]|uniref:hypothetical protein n=1 Tax=Streptomyces sp. NRRL F-2664 TaxID=1463842 RepID=UPI00131B3E1F|nr:hypothetical protein [Streptomyces sp. NRRL F-2664]